MNRKGYVINYDGNGSIFVEEASFLTAIEYLQAEGERIKETYWIELSEEEEQVLPILDSSSFGYMVGYGDSAVEEDDITNIFVPQDDLKATCDRLHEQGYKVWGFNWTCPIIVRMKGAQKHMNNRYHNGGATEEQLEELKKLCEALFAKDETQKSFIDQIYLKTDGFTCITEEACKSLIGNLEKINAAYGAES